MNSIFDNIQMDDMLQVKPIETGLDNIKAYTDRKEVTALVSCNIPEHIPVQDPLWERAKFWIEQQLNRTFPECKFKVYPDKICKEKSINLWGQPTFAQGYGSNPFVNSSSPWGNH